MKSYLFINNNIKHYLFSFNYIKNYLSFINSNMNNTFMGYLNVLHCLQFIQTSWRVKEQSDKDNSISQKVNLHVTENKYWNEYR